LTSSDLSLKGGEMSSEKGQTDSNTGLAVEAPVSQSFAIRNEGATKRKTPGGKKPGAIGQTTIIMGVNESPR
jgi:hypothetical protein